MANDVITKQEYLHGIQKEADTVRNLQKNGYMLLFKKSWILFLACGLGLGAGFFGTHLSREKAYATFQQTGNLVYQDMDVKDIFAQWNQANNGNDVNILLEGGKLLTRKGKFYTGAPAGQLQGKFHQLPASSFLNLVGSTLYYREDASRNVLALDLASQTAKVFIQGNIGEVFCTNDTMFYVDHDQNDQIFARSLSEGGEPQRVFAEPVVKFAVLGKGFLVLQANRKVSYIEGKTEQYLVNADDFVIAEGKIYAQNQNRIVRLAPSGKGASKVYEGSEKLQLMGVSGSTIYFLEGQTVKKLQGSAATGVEAPSFLLAASLSTAEDGSRFFVGYQQEQKKPLEQQVIQVQ